MIVSAFAQAVHREPNACDEYNPKLEKADEKDKRHEQFFQVIMVYDDVDFGEEDPADLDKSTRITVEGWGFMFY